MVFLHWLYHPPKMNLSEFLFCLFFAALLMAIVIMGLDAPMWEKHFWPLTVWNNSANVSPMNKITVNDKNNFYFGREAEIVETNEINGKIIHRVQIENISFALEEKDVLRAWRERVFNLSFTHERQRIPVLSFCCRLFGNYDYYGTGCAKSLRFLNLTNNLFSFTFSHDYQSKNPPRCILGRLSRFWISSTRGWNFQQAPKSSLRHRSLLMGGFCGYDAKIRTN